jgi:hypothetical protein
LSACAYGLSALGRVMAGEQPMLAELHERSVRREAGSRRVVLDCGAEGLRSGSIQSGSLIT